MAYWNPPTRGAKRPLPRLQAEHNMDGLDHPQPHLLSSPPGTPAPVGLINYTPDTGEVHAPGVLAPVDKQNYSLMPHDADLSGVGAGQASTAMGSLQSQWADQQADYKQNPTPWNQPQRTFTTTGSNSMGAGVDWGNAVGPAIASPGSPPGTTGSGRYAPAQSARDNQFSPGQPPIAAHPYGTGPGPQLQATGPEVRDFAQRGSMIGNTGPFGAGQEAPADLQKKHRTGLDDDPPDQNGGTQAADQQPAATATPATTPNPADAALIASAGIPAYPGYHARVDRDANNRPISVTLVSDTPGKPEIPWGGFIPGEQPDPVKGIPTFQTYPDSVRAQIMSGAIKADTTQVIQSQGPDGKMHNVLIDRVTGKPVGDNNGDLGVSQKEPTATPKEPTLGTPGSRHVIFENTPYALVYKVGDDGKEVYDAEATAAAQAGYTQKTAAEQAAKDQTAKINQQTQYGTTAYFDTFTDAQGQTYLLNKNTGDRYPVGSADQEKGYKVVGNSVVKLPTTPGEKPSVMYEAPHDMKIDTIGGKTVQYDPRDPMKTMQTVYEDPNFAENERLKQEKARLDMEKTRSDMAAGRITNAEGIAKLEQTAYDIAHPKATFSPSGKDIYIPEGMQLDIDYGAYGGVKHYDTGTNADAQGMAQRIRDSLSELRSGSTGTSTSTQPAAQPAAQAAATTSSTAPATTTDTSTQAAPKKEDLWMRADQEKDRTPAGNAQATEAGLTGTVAQDDPRWLGTKATPEEVEAAKASAAPAEEQTDETADTGEETEEERLRREQEEQGAGNAGWDPRMGAGADFNPLDPKTWNESQGGEDDVQKRYQDAMDALNKPSEGGKPPEPGSTNQDQSLWETDPDEARYQDELDRLQRQHPGADDDWSPGYDEPPPDVRPGHGKPPSEDDEGEQIEWMKPAAHDPDVDTEADWEDAYTRGQGARGDERTLDPLDTHLPQGGGRLPGVNDPFEGDTPYGQVPEPPPGRDPQEWADLYNLSLRKAREEARDELKGVWSNPEWGNIQPRAPEVNSTPFDPSQGPQVTDKGGLWVPKVPAGHVPGAKPAPPKPLINTGIGLPITGGHTPGPQIQLPSWVGAGQDGSHLNDPLFHSAMQARSMGSGQEPAPPPGASPPIPPGAQAQPAPPAGPPVQPSAPVAGGGGPAQAGPQGGAPPMPPGGPGWTPPVQPDDVAGIGHRFGQPMDQGEPIHSGVDLQAMEGTDTIAPVDGMIEDVQNDPQGLGLTVIVRGNDGSMHKLGHLKSTDVYRGMQVAKGQNLMSKVGSSGNTTGSHLHWAVRDQQGAPVDPTSSLGPMASLPPVPGTQMMGPPGGSSSPPGAAAPPAGPPPGGPPPQGMGQDNVDARWDLYEQRDKQGFFAPQSSHIGAGQASGWDPMPSPFGDTRDPFAGMPDPITGQIVDPNRKMGDPRDQSNDPPDLLRELEEMRQQHMGAGNQGNIGDARTLFWGVGAGAEGGMGAGAPAVAMTPSQQAEIAARNREIAETERHNKEAEAQAKANEENRHAEALAKIDQDWRVHQDQNQRQIEINAENTRHNQAAEQLQRDQMQNDKDLEQMKEAAALKEQQITEGNKVYMQQGQQAFQDWQNQQQARMQILSSALQNPWLQKLTGTTPGPGYNANMTGGQNISNLMNQILTPYDVNKFGVAGAPDYSGFGTANNAAANPTAAQQAQTQQYQTGQYVNQSGQPIDSISLPAQRRAAAGGATGAIPNQLDASGQPASASDGQMQAYQLQDTGTSSAQGAQQATDSTGQTGGTADQQPNWETWSSWDPFQKAAYRTNVEAAGPGAWAQTGQQMANQFAQQGGNPNVTAMQAAAGGAVGRAGMEMNADIFGQNATNFWNDQQRQWSRAQAPQVKQSFGGIAA